MVADLAHYLQHTLIPKAEEFAKNIGPDYAQDEMRIQHMDGEIMDCEAELIEAREEIDLAGPRDDEFDDFIDDDDAYRGQGVF